VADFCFLEERAVPVQGVARDEAGEEVVCAD
jgi:hypothetical protein